MISFCCAISLSSCYRDEWLARKFNTATKWAVVMTSLPTDIHISNVWSTWCDLIMWSLDSVQILRVAAGSPKNWNKAEWTKTWRIDMISCDRGPHPTWPGGKQQLKNNSSRCCQVQFLFTICFLCSFFETSLLAVIWNKKVIIMDLWPDRFLCHT